MVNVEISRMWPIYKTNSQTVYSFNIYISLATGFKLNQLQITFKDQ